MTGGQEHQPALAAGLATGPGPPSDGRLAEPPRSPGPLLGRAGRTVAVLFPQAPARSRSRAAVCGLVLANLLAIVLGAVVQLERQGGVPAWQSIWAEDHSKFLPQALTGSWRSVLQPYDGYIELVPRLFAQLVASLPLRDAAAAFAIAGAVVASCVAVLVFHASSGHVRRPELRVLLAASVLLLPTALTEIANSGVNSPWYLLFGVFWALLWRPRGIAGMVTAGLLCFAAASSQALVALYLPLVVARIVALPRIREQAATIGWAAGGLLQVRPFLTAAGYTQTTTPGRALAFFGHNVILPTVAGHHAADLLWMRFGLGGATAITACVFAAVVIWMLIQGGTRVRVFVLTALVLGLLLCLVPVLIHGDVANSRPLLSRLFVKGSRYGQAPILIFASALIVAVDAFVRRTGIRLERAAHVTAVAALAAVLAFTWVSDYRYVNARSAAQPWTQTVARIRLHCQQQPHVGVRQLGRISCSRLRK